MPDPKIRVVLQARSGSSRLPAKVLLPLSNMPMAVLCAKRVGKVFDDLVVATSSHTSDDALVVTLKKNGVKYLRGELGDVLSRFVMACEDLDIDDIIVRLTGDNPFVDGDFVNDVIQSHLESKACYTRTLSPQDGFPYGMSAEVLRVGFLRDIDAVCLSAYEREHVTIKPTLEQKFHLFNNSYGPDLSRLRLTVDTFDDYLRAWRIFEKAGRWDCSWKDIVEIAMREDDLPKHYVPRKYKELKPHSHMALGTVQLGLDYGIANQSGKPDNELAKQIIIQALKYGIDIIDTAAAYGCSESIIGRSLSDEQKQAICITTKLDPLKGLTENTSDDEIVMRVERSVYKSLCSLRMQQLPVLMLHRWDHIEIKRGLVLETLNRMRAQGHIAEIGASVESPQEGLAALEYDDITFIQLPFNILDKRWARSGFIEKLKNVRISNRKHIQVRSIYLQGLLAMELAMWPDKFRAESAQIIPALDKALKLTGVSDVRVLCLNFVRSQEWIDSIVIGVETLTQLQQNVELFNYDMAFDKHSEEILILIPDLPESFLNPAIWEEINDN
jgi:spore coat polysaccharide biosynthesis protein SpsF